MPLIGLFIAIAVGCTTGDSGRRVEDERQDSIQRALDLQQQQLDLQARQLEIRQQELSIKMDSLTLAAASDSGGESEDLSELYAEVRDGVFLVYAAGDSGVAQGSAFLVSECGLAVSNYHVFEKASAAILYNNKGQEFLISEVVDMNDSLDYFTFRIGPLSEEIKWLDVASSSPRIGERCFAIGNPLGLEQTLSEGVVSQLRSEQIQTTAEITHGSSGGALFNMQGEVIGVTTSGMGEANLNFALAIDQVPLRSMPCVEDQLETGPSKADVPSIIEAYYDAYLASNWSALRPMYCDTLSRFFSNFDAPVEVAMSAAEDYDQKFKVLEKSLQVRWETLDIKERGDGSLVCQYVMDYNLVRKDRTKPSAFVLEIVCVINPDGCISSIYENILASS